MNAIPRFLILALLFCLFATEVSAVKLFRKQTGTIVLTTTSQTVTILPVTMGRTFMFFSCTGNSDNGGDLNGSLLVGGEITNSTTLTFTRSAITANATIVWQVFEFASGVTVQHGSTTSVGNPTNVAITAVDLTKSFVITSGQNATFDFGTDDTFTADLTSTTNLRLTSTGTYAKAFWQVVQYSDCIVKKVTATMSDPALTATSTITPAITTLSKAMVLSNHTISGTVSTNAHVLPTTALTNATTVTYTRIASHGTAIYNFVTYVIEFTDNTTVSRSSTNFAIGEASKTAFVNNNTISSGIFGPGNFGRQGTATCDNQNLGYVWFYYDFVNRQNISVTRGNGAGFAGTIPWQVANFENQINTYYSLSSGVWESNARWSLTSDGASGPLPAGEFPSRLDNVVIRAGHTITVDNVADNFYAGVIPDNLLNTLVGPFVGSNVLTFYHTGDIQIDGTLTISVGAMIGGYTRIASGGTLTTTSTLINIGNMDADSGSTLTTLDDLVLSGASITTINTSSTSADDLIIDHTSATLCGTGTSTLQNGSGSAITFANSATLAQVCTLFTINCTGVGCSGFPVVGTTVVIPGNTGPGGVGATDATNLILWLDATTLSGADNTLITTWPDRSGYAHNFAAGNGALLRTNAINGYPILEFNGTSHYFERAYTAALNPASISIFAANRVTTSGAYKTVISSRKGPPTTGGYIMYSIPTSNNWTFWNGNGGGAWDELDATSTAGSWASQTAIYNTVGNIKSLSVRNGAAVSQTPTFVLNTNTNTRIGAGSNEGVPLFFFPGRMGEVIVYKVPTNAAQAVIINNYLAAKYNFTLTANDVYNMDNAGTDFDHEVAGVGQLGTSVHRDAQGTGMVRMWNPQSMISTEFMMWGHNNGSLATTTRTVGTDVDGTNIVERLVRVWAIGETGDVGTVNISFNYGALPNVPIGSSLRLLIDRDNDNFGDNDVTPIAPSSWSGTVVTFNLVNFNNGDRFTLGNTNAAAPLPIELISFAARAVENSVLLSWRTLTETNNDFFTLHRSTDGEKWEEIAKIPGAGTSNATHDYERYDDHPLQGTSYYRVKQTDYDGRYSYSSVVKILYERSSLIVSPNPSTGIYKVTGERTESLYFEVINSLGQNVSFTMDDRNGTGIDISNHPAGVYILKVFDNRSQRIFRIVKE